MTDPASYTNLGKIETAVLYPEDKPGPGQVRTIIFLLAGSVALMMTGFGIIMPVFARRLGEFGSGVEALGLMIMSFALAQLIAAPLMGSLADRLGRRPLVILSLISFTLANVGFLWAPTTPVFIMIRSLEGALIAGLFPASMGIVADLVPEKERAQWVGIVMGSYSAGFIFGPVIGGVLYDLYGFKAPFIASAVMGLLGFIAASLLVPETRPVLIRKRERLQDLRNSSKQKGSTASFLSSLPEPKYIFFTILLLNFIGAFSFAFIEPQLIFYFYDDLNWSTTRFGVVVGVFGTAMVICQMFLGRLSDRFGRKPIIFIGFLLSLPFFFGLTFITTFSLMILVAFIAGMGDALRGPALSAFALDISKKQYRSRIIGFKESALALGGVAGPGLVAIIGSRVTPQTIFMMAGVTICFGALVSIGVLKEPVQVLPKEEDDIWDLIGKRQIAAQASTRGIITWARSVRGGQ